MKRFDLRETIIPFSLLEAANHFKKMACGDRMQIISYDVAPVEDLQSILPSGSFVMDAPQEDPEKAGGYRTIIRKLSQ